MANKYDIAGTVEAAQWRGDNVNQMRRIDPECGTSPFGTLLTHDGQCLSRGQWLVKFPPKSLAVVSDRAFRRLVKEKVE